MKLEIILRTHDGKNIHGPDKPRYIDIPKKDLIIGCLSSLINSANLVRDFKIHLKILDDHSSLEFVTQMKNILKYFNHSWEIIHLEERGYNHSGYMQFLACKNSASDLVYCVEDDYLHCEKAIREMVYSFFYLKKEYNLKKELCIFPFDNPEDYQKNQIYPGRVFKSDIRHWKEGIWTTFTMMTPPKVFQDHWKTFEKLSLNYRPWNGIDPIEDMVHEGNTITNIWMNDVIRVNPIPSLALHIQYEKQRDTFINHLEWWDKYSKIKKGIKFY